MFESANFTIFKSFCPNAADNTLNKCLINVPFKLI